MGQSNNRICYGGFVSTRSPEGLETEGWIEGGQPCLGGPARQNLHTKARFGGSFLVGDRLCVSHILVGGTDTAHDLTRRGRPEAPCTGSLRTPPPRTCALDDCDLRPLSVRSHAESGVLQRSSEPRAGLGTLELAVGAGSEGGLGDVPDPCTFLSCSLPP